MKATVTGFEPEDGRWRVDIRDAAPLEADALIVATGGLSVPSTGSDGTGLRVAEALGHSVRPAYPALTPLVANPAPFGALSGVSLPVTITARADGLASTASGGFLFTHHGYSGPAVLDVSHVAVRSRLEALVPARIVVQWAPLGDEEWTAVLKPRTSRTVLTAVGDILPARLAEALIRTAGVDPRLPLAHLARGDRLRLIDRLVRSELPWTGDEGYRKAEVTGGGVSLTDIDPKTMGSRRHKGLFLCGEMLDAFGPIGGNNFLWAWATGRAAGLGASATIKGLASTEGFSS